MGKDVIVLIYVAVGGKVLVRVEIKPDPGVGLEPTTSHSAHRLPNLNATSTYRPAQALRSLLSLSAKVRPKCLTSVMSRGETPRKIIVRPGSSVGRALDSMRYVVRAHVPVAKVRVQNATCA